MENIAIFVEHYIKSYGTSHASYLQDTPDFLRFIDKINKETTLPNDAMLVLIDVIGLYNNIPQDEGGQFFLLVTEILQTKMRVYSYC